MPKSNAQQDSVGQVAEHSVRRVVDEFATIQMRNDRYASWQLAVIQLRNLLVERVQRGIGLRALAQQHDAFHHIVIIDDGAIFAPNCLSQLTQTNSRGLHNDAQIAHSDWSAVLHPHNCGSNIVSGLHQADGAHIECLLAALDKATAGIDVVRG